MTIRGTEEGRNRVSHHPHLTSQFRSVQYQLPCSYTRKRKVRVGTLTLPHNPGPDTAKVIIGYIPLSLNPCIAPMDWDLRPVLAPTKWSQSADITTALGCIKPSTTTPQDCVNISSHKILPQYFTDHKKPRLKITLLPKWPSQSKYKGISDNLPGLSG